MPSFPTSLPVLANPSGADDLDTPAVLHSAQHANANDEIEAIAAKVGVNGSAVTSTLDYKLTNVASADPGHTHTLYVPKSLVDAKGDLIVASAADTVIRVPIGTNDQVLTADSAQASGLKWATPSSGGIPATLLDAKGDLIAASAADTAARLAVGTNGQVLTADSAESAGMKWATPSSGSPWTTTVDESGASFANWTSLGGGTWASDGTIISQTSTAAGVKTAVYANKVPLASCLYECDFRMPSAGQASDIYVGLTIAGTSNSDPTGGLLVRVQRVSGTWALNFERTSQMAHYTPTISALSLDTWYTLRVLYSGKVASVWLDGTFMAGSSYDHGGNGNWHWIFLYVNGAKADFRNIKLRTPTLP